MAAGVPRRVGPLRVWVGGLFVLIAAFWLLVHWVVNHDTAADAAAPPAGEAVEDRVAAITEAERNSIPIPLAAIVPLGPGDTGINTTFAGAVVGEPVADGAWIRTGVGTVFVRVVDDAATLVAGDFVHGRGIVRHAPDRVGGWVDEAALDERERARLVVDYYIETTADRLFDPSPE